MATMPSPPAPVPGFRATVAALSIGQILSWATLYYGFSSFVLPMMRGLGWDKATVMGAFTLGLATWGGATYAVGAAIDRGHGRAVLTGGALLSGLGCLAWSQVASPVALYASWALLGATMAMTLYDPAFNILTQRYPDRYRQGITWLTLVGGFASTLSFPACAALIAGLGWRGALVVLGMVQLLLVAPLHAWALQGPALVRTAAPAHARSDATLHEALRHPAFWLLTLCFTLYAFASAALWAHVMPAFEAKGWSATEALAVLVWIGPAQVFARFALAWGGRGLALRAVGVVVMLAMPASLVVFALATQGWALALFAALFGMANGLVTIVRGGLVPEYFGRSEIGRISGAMGAMGLLARAAAPLLTAWLLLAMAGYAEVMLVLAGVGLAAAVAFLFARPPR
jgi:MFS family permease